MTKKSISLTPLLLVCFGCSAGDPGADELAIATTHQALLSPVSNDLDVGFIQRMPVIDYVQNSTNPRVEGWPTAGQNVTWRANVHNFSSTARTVNYVWSWDGASVKTGSVSLAANSTTAVDYVRPWAFERHELKFKIDSSNTFIEIEEGNNELAVVSDAISVALYVEQGLYDYFNEHQRELSGAGSNSWDDWAQRQVRLWNQMFQNAVYPGDTPSGVLDRIRLDKIVVVSDNALPLAGGLATNNPNFDDRSVDLQWGFPSTLLGGAGYTGNRNIDLNNPFYYEGSLIHELLHARYLLDNYGFNVHAMPGNTGRDSISISEGGQNIVGTDYLPMVSSDAVYYTDEAGMMNGDYTYIDQYGAMALNLIAGRRAVDGNMNAPGNFAAFVNDLASDNEITLLDASTGAALAGASVQIYRSTGGSNGYASKVFDGTADLSFTANSSGKIRVGRNPFSSGALSGWHESTVMLLRVAHSGRVRYVFMDVADFNKEYWRGHTTLGQLTLPVEFPGASSGVTLPAKLQAEDYVRYSDTSTGNSGNQYRSDDVDIEATTDAGAGYNVGWTEANEWLEFDVDVPTAGSFDFVARVASNTTGKTIRLAVDGVTVGSSLTAPSAGWQSWADRSVNGVSLAAGAHTVRVTFETGAVNLNYVDVRSAPAPTGVTVPAKLEAEAFVRFSDSTAGNTGGGCPRAGDVDMESTGDSGGGCNVGWTTAGEWLEFDVNVSAAGVFDLVSRVASDTSSRTFHLEVDGVTVGGAQSAPGLGWQSWQDRAVSGVSLTAGAHRVRVVFDSGSVNLNYVDVRASSAIALPARIEAESYVRYSDSSSGNQGGQCRSDNVDCELTTDGSTCNVGWTTAGEWLEWDVALPSAQTLRLTARVASASSGKTFHVEVDGVNVSGSLTAPNGGWQAFADRTVSGIALSAGAHRVRVVFDSGDVNLNWIQFAP